MTVLALIFFVAAVIEGAILIAGYHVHLQQGVAQKRVWQLVDDLENDKRALTESLCRAQGKPFIPSGPRVLQPSAGWFDGKPVVTAKDSRAS